MSFLCCLEVPDQLHNNNMEFHCVGWGPTHYLVTPTWVELSRVGLWQFLQATLTFIGTEFKTVSFQNIYLHNVSKYFNKTVLTSAARYNPTNQMLVTLFLEQLSYLLLRVQDTILNSQQVNHIMEKHTTRNTPPIIPKSLICSLEIFLFASISLCLN